MADLGSDRDWSEKAKGLLKAELKRRSITYAGLVQALADLGIAETEANLRNKISRGNFSAAFMLQCLEAIGCGVLYLSTDVTVLHGRAPISDAVKRKLAASRKASEADSE